MVLTKSHQPSSRRRVAKNLLISREPDVPCGRSYQQLNKAILCKEDQYTSIDI